MCHFLYLASPLTLSEVRSMLPAGLAADPLPPLDTRRFQRHLPGRQSASRLLVGACSCDLILDRDPDDHRDESHLRRRYRALGLSRDAIIQAIDRHRQGIHPRNCSTRSSPNMPGMPATPCSIASSPPAA